MCYSRNLSVYFHIFEVKDHNSDITISAVSTIALQIQGHTHFCVTFHISGWVRAIGEMIDLGVYFHIFKVKDHNNDITNTLMLTVDF